LHFAAIGRRWGTWLAPWGEDVVSRCSIWDNLAILTEVVKPMSFSLRVAIADDDPAMRESLQQMLCDLGHEVVAMADNGESLIEQCAMTEPDVVITGTLTPKMYGSEAAGVVYKSQPIPLILYAGQCEPVKRMPTMPLQRIKRAVGRGRANGSRRPRVTVFRQHALS
jgi:CheY-like chemotaxis protein